MVEPENPSSDSLTAEEPGGFTQVPDSLLLNADVSDGAYRLYALLKHHARSTRSAWPGRRALARALGVKSVRTVDARITELKEFGYLVVTPRFHELGGQRSNLYHLRFYPVQSAAPPPGNELHGAGAADCDGSVQPVATQRSTSLEDTPTPTTPTGPTARAAARRAVREVSSSGAAASTAVRRRQGEGTSPTPGEDGDRLAPSEYVEEFLAACPSALWPRSSTQRSALAQLLAPAASAWPVPELLQALLRGRPLPEEVTHPIGLLRSRLEQLPPRQPKVPWPPWCGLCDERTRLVEDDVADTVGRCPHCHPQVAPQTKESA